MGRGIKAIALPSRFGKRAWTSGLGGRERAHKGYFHLRSISQLRKGRVSLPRRGSWARPARLFKGGKKGDGGRKTARRPVRKTSAADRADWGALSTGLCAMRKETYGIALDQRGGRREGATTQCVPFRILSSAKAKGKKNGGTDVGPPADGQGLAVTRSARHSRLACEAHYVILLDRMSHAAEGNRGPRPPPQGCVVRVKDVM